MNCKKQNCICINCSLCRSGRLSRLTYLQAKRRIMDWTDLQNSTATKEDSLDLILECILKTTEKCELKDMHMEVEEGAYSVTVDESGSNKQQKHFFYISKGETVNLTFQI
ncbi:uncharacterized protein LOC124816217 isoform X1 [Hydra vulgaris]|uniref:uncharacterized protein LOC124816217 isoform X1 n=1 Tax=Hydra vulgaris TaxID=6087 RepID=UPI001F5E8DE5|nr:uncharacterized protein LOC124816217 [Hydra vulgaris]